MFNEYFPLFEFLQKQGTKVYLVGGAVRDLLLNHASHDLDFVVLGDAAPLARKTANHFHGAYYLMDAEHGIARVLMNIGPYKNLILDFSDARGGTLENDLVFRDFTINAIALDLDTQKSVDPLEGALHLRQKLLKACSPESFLEDPIRVLRAFRFSLYLGLHIESETKKLLYQAAPLLSNISGERQRDELFRIFSGGKSAAALRVLHHAGIMDIVTPEMKTLMEGRTSVSVDLTVKMLQNLDMILNFIEGKRTLIPDTLFSSLIFLYFGRFRLKLLGHLQNQLNSDRSLRGLICLAGVFFPVFSVSANRSWNSEAISPKIDLLNERLKSLALSKAEIQYFQRIITNTGLFFELQSRVQKVSCHESHDMAEMTVELDRRKIYRYFKACGESGIDICLLSLALYAAQSGLELDQPEFVRLLHIACQLFDGYWDHNSAVVNPHPLITGTDLMNDLSIPASEKIGQILDLIREEQAAGNLHTRDQALDFARKYLHR